MRREHRPAVVLLHGWPGLGSDFRRVIPLLEPYADVLAPDLEGYGENFSGPVAEDDTTAEAHARRVLALVTDRAHDRAHDRALDRALPRPLLAGYDIGSRVAQAAARLAPDLIGGLVVTPGYPGIGARSLEPGPQAAYWYQHLHRLPLASAMLDGNPAALRAYLGHFWTHWAAEPGLAEGPDFDALVAAYRRPGAFGASITWYRANRVYATDVDPIMVPTTVLWGARDPLFPTAWADRLPEFFADADLTIVPGAGHFLPVEAPQVFADAILRRLGARG